MVFYLGIFFVYLQVEDDGCWFFVCLLWFFSFLSKCSLVCNMTIHHILIVSTDESWVKYRQILPYSDTIKRQLREVFYQKQELILPWEILNISSGYIIKVQSYYCNVRATKANGGCKSWLWQISKIITHYYIIILHTSFNSLFQNQQQQKRLLEKNKSQHSLLLGISSSPVISFFFLE